MGVGALCLSAMKGADTTGVKHGVGVAIIAVAILILIALGVIF